jgi:adenylate cyclase
MRIPDRVQTLLAGLAVVAITASAVLVPGQRGWLAGLSMDTLFGLREFAYGPRRPAGPDTQVALVLIDEDTYALPPFHGLSKDLWTPFFASVIGAVDAAEPRVIGFDIILPSSLERLVPELKGYEHSFRDALRQAGDADRLVLAKFYGQGVPVVPAREQVMAVGGAANVRAANMDEDADGIVRRLPLVWTDIHGKPETSFGGELARRAGIDFGGRTQVLLNWDGGQPFPTYSFADMYACAQAGNQAFFRQAFGGKVVLIATGLDVEDRLITSRRFINPPERIGDRRCTPLPNGARLPRGHARVSLPGAFTYATAIDNLLHNEALVPLSGPERLAGVVAAAGLSTLLAADLPLVAGALGLAALLALIAIVNTVLLAHGIAAPLLEAFAAAVLAFALMVAFRFTFSDRDKRRIRKIFGLYLAPSVIERLVATGRMPELGGERREMTFFFSDIAGFTSFAEGADPAVLAPILNAYFDGVCDIILRYGGLVVDFAGDGLHALFGAPADQPDHARRGVDAARAVAAFVETFRQARNAQGIALGHTRIGLHTGPALVGNLGAIKRLKYTALGDAVNTAARLEGLNKYFGTRCCISEATRLASGETDLRPIGDIVLKGRREAIRVYDLLLERGAEAPAVRRYVAAFERLGDGDTAELMACFQALVRDDPTDGCARFHLARLAAGERTQRVVMEEK